MPVRGSCLCGDFRFEIEPPFEMLASCHCSMCRRAHGAAFATYLVVGAGALRRTGEARSVLRYDSSPGAHRSSCARCGSVVPYEAPDGRHWYVPAGLLDDDPGIRPQAHIFADSKARWHEISDALPRFEGYPPGMGEAFAAKRTTEPSLGRVRGGCLCGAVAYEIDAPIEGPLVCCHCSRCRKARGAAHASNLFTGTSSFRWLRGEERLRAYRVPEALRFTHVFCGVCGSSLPRVDPERGRTVVPAGTLEDDPGIREGLHIFVGSKAPWFEIVDHLPRHDSYPPGAFPPPETR